MSICVPFTKPNSADTVTKPHVLVAIALPSRALDVLATDYTVHQAPTGADRDRVLGECGQTIRAVVTNGTTGLDKVSMDRMPNLEIVACLGAGFENVDVDTARARAITITHGPRVNDACVADHALGLVLSLLRAIPAVDRGIRAGRWHELRGDRPGLTGQRLGLLGLGSIGQKIAARANGFDMTIAYHTRRARPELDYRYASSPVELAANCDVLVVACPGGPSTRHLVGEEVLTALGPQGILVNVARGSVVDTAALIAALEEGKIAGAALDVLEGEPTVPPQFHNLDNVILTPHMAGRSPESSQASYDLVAANLRAHFAGLPVLTPVPA